MRKRLLKKWDHPLHGLTDRAQQARRQLWYDYQGRSIPHILVQAAKHRAEEQRYLSAMALLARAAARYGYFGLRGLVK